MLKNLRMPPILWIIASPALFIYGLGCLIYFVLQWIFTGCWECENCFETKNYKDKKHILKHNDTQATVCEKCYKEEKLEA